MRVLHVAQPTTAGVARVVVDLVRHQVARGHDVHLAAPAGGTLAAEAVAAGARWEAWAATRSPGASTVREVRTLTALCARVRPDVVHLHSSKAGLAGRLAVRSAAPTVFQPHAWSFQAQDGLMSRAATAWERAALRWTAALLCVSVAERDAGVAAGVRAARTLVVPNGVDLSRWTAASADDRAAARTQLGLSPAPLAVCVGRLAVQKGQDVLLDAWPSVLSAVPDAELVLVGDGPQADELRARGSRSTVFVGDRPDVASWIAAADVVVVPSRWEAMALVPLEAMARARCVVATDAEGVVEQLPPSAGAVVPRGDAEALAAALASRLSDRPASDLQGRAGREHVERHHDVRRTAAAVEACYTSLR